MVRYFKTRNNNDILALCISAFLLIIGFSLAKRLLFSHYTLLLGDLQGLYAPICRMFVNKILYHNDLFGPGNFFYASNAGYGLDIASYASGNVLFSPFNIFFLIFKSDQVACACLIISKLSFAAFFFQRYLRKVHSIDGLPSICWAVLYSMCGYCTVYFLNILFLDGVYLLPLIISLCYEFINKNINSTKLAIGYFAMFMCGIFPSYIIGIFSFLFFIASLFVSESKGKLKKLFLYFKAVFMGFLLSMFMILPSIYSVLTSVASDSTKYDGTVPDILHIIGNMFIGVTQTNAGSIPYFYSGLLAFVYIPVFFFSKKITVKNKIVWGIVTGFLLLCSIVPFMYIAIHGFNYPDTYAYRFAYLVSFGFITMIAVAHKNVPRISNIIFFLGLMLGLIIYFYLLYVVKAQGISEFGLIVNSIFAIIYVILLSIRSKRKRVFNFIYILILFEILVNFYMVLRSEQYLVVNYKPTIYDAEADLGKAIDTLKASDDSIYRIYIPNALSDSYQMSTDTLRGVLFSSIEDERARKTVFRLGLQTSVRLMMDNGLTDATKMILGYKYDINSYSIIQGEDKYDAKIVENPYYLGMGYMVADDIYRLSLADDYNAFENINRTLSSLYGEEVNYFEPVDVDVDIYEDGVSYFEFDDKYSGYALDEGVGNGQVTFLFKSDKRCYAYNMLDFTTYIDTEPCFYSIGGDMGTFTMKQCAYTPQIIKLGRNSDGYYNFNYAINYNNTNKYVLYKDILFYYDNEEALKKVYDYLKDNTYDISVFEDGYIRGTVEATEEKSVLFLSIAYNDNWKVYIDGVQGEIKPGLNGTFITCDLEPGLHEVVFKYTSPFVVYGNIITLIGVLLVIIDYFYCKRRNFEKIYQERTI